jgi:hypothetical protein
MDDRSLRQRKFFFTVHSSVEDAEELVRFAYDSADSILEDWGDVPASSAFVSALALYRAAFAIELGLAAQWNNPVLPAAGSAGEVRSSGGSACAGVRRSEGCSPGAAGGPHLPECSAPDSS